MELCKNKLRFSINPLNLLLRARKKEGLRIGYMQAAMDGLYLNGLQTGADPQKLIQLLSEKFNCFDADSSCQLLSFIATEGERASFSIMLPYLLSTDTLEEFENVIRKHFYGIERFIQQGKNLYNFVKYIEERGEPIIWINDLERGVTGWDMGQLVTIARIAKDCEYITQEQAWEYIDRASEICMEHFHTPEEIDKSFLIGGAMKSDKIKDWENLIFYYSELRENER